MGCMLAMKVRAWPLYPSAQFLPPWLGVSPLGRPYLSASFLMCNQRTPLQMSGCWGWL